MTALIAGVDSSTQSCTIELRSADDGRLLSVGRSPHPPTYPPVSEQDPAAWWTAFGGALAEACQKAGVSPSQIKALSIGAQCHGLVAIGADGQPLRPAKLWNDTTGAPDVARLIQERPQSSWVNEVLVPMNPALTIAKLAWVARNEHDVLERISRIMLPHDWLTWRLTGEHVTDRSDASGTGYYNAPTNTYRVDLLEQHIDSGIDWATLMPKVLGPSEVAGRILPAVADETGLPIDCVVGPGGGDQHLAAVGMGLAQGETAFSLGTSGVVFSSSPDPIIDLQARVDGVCDATGGYLPLLCTLNCTKVTDLMARLLGVDHQTLESMAFTAAPSDLAFLPYLDGERAPMRPGATGMIMGMRSDTTREQLALSAYLGVVGGLVKAFELLGELMPYPVDRRLIAVGGGAKSLAYRQLLADQTRRPVTRVDAPEATARGAAIQAGAVLLGADIAELRDAWRPATVDECEPRPERIDTPNYETLYEYATERYSVQI